MKVAIVSILAAGAAVLGACATTTTTDNAALSGGQMVEEFVAVSQKMRAIDAAVWSLDPIPGRPSVVQRQVLGRLVPLWKRREELRVALYARRFSLTADEIGVLIDEIDRQLAVADDAELAPSDVRAGISRPFLRSQYTGGDTWARPEPNLYVTRLDPGSTGMRHSEWRRIYRLKEEREAFYKAMRKRAVAPVSESLSASLPPGPGARG